MVKIIIACLIALSIGALCRYFEIPVPAPPKLLGALLIVAITVGYLGTDWALTRRAEPAAANVSPADGTGGSAPTND